MTIEEAIDYNKNLRMYMRLTDKNQPCKFLEENYIALDMAIKALEQGDVLDKIRAEIDGLLIDGDSHDTSIYFYNSAVKSVLKIIDKHKIGGGQV